MAQLPLPFGVTRFELSASTCSWRNADGTIGRVTVGAHCVDLAWPWL